MTESSPAVNRRTGFLTDSQVKRPVPVITRNTSVWPGIQGILSLPLAARESACTAANYLYCSYDINS
jgi:hypothetical protein